MRILLTPMAPISSFVHHGALHLHHPILLVKGLTESKGYKIGARADLYVTGRLRMRSVVSGWSREPSLPTSMLNNTSNINGPNGIDVRML